MNAMLRNALRQYSSVGVRSGVEDASPHRLIQMLLEGALARIAAAIGHLDRGDVAEKGRSIGLAISIIGGLQSSLDTDRGGDVAGNLDRLYEYMARRLLEANAKSDRGALEEVHRLLSEVKGAWDSIGSRAGSGAPVTFPSPARG
ncbi:MAG: flagellar export chaperone FliS [Gammaproteobacteria bacterium]|jgi:flagellar protein FliS|nr:flagellar export chaperone FliS [Gammaproteobacteria bacterium]